MMRRDSLPLACFLSGLAVLAIPAAPATSSGTSSMKSLPPHIECSCWPGFYYCSAARVLHTTYEAE